MAKTVQFRIGNRQIIHSDTPKKKKTQEKLTLYYCLGLKGYDTFISSGAEFSYVVESTQSADKDKGHYSGVSTRTLTDKECNSIDNHTITVKGQRFPGDTNANELDNNGNLIQRNLSNTYLEEYEITFYDKNTRKNIGGISGLLQYIDDRIDNITSVSQLRFPISAAYGVCEMFVDGYIDWNYDNAHPLLFRTLEVYSKP